MDETQEFNIISLNRLIALLKSESDATRNKKTRYRCEDHICKYKNHDKKKGFLTDDLYKILQNVKSAYIQSIVCYKGVTETNISPQDFTKMLQLCSNNIVKKQFLEFYLEKLPQVNENFLVEILKISAQKESDELDLFNYYTENLVEEISRDDLQDFVLNHKVFATLDFEKLVTLMEFREGGPVVSGVKSIATMFQKIYGQDIALERFSQFIDKVPLLADFTKADFFCQITPHLAKLKISNPQDFLQIMLESLKEEIFPEKKQENIDAMQIIEEFNANFPGEFVVEAIPNPTPSSVKILNSQSKDFRQP